MHYRPKELVSLCDIGLLRGDCALFFGHRCLQALIFVVVGLAPYVVIVLELPRHFDERGPNVHLVPHAADW